MSCAEEAVLSWLVLCYYNILYVILPVKTPRVERVRVQ
jgi:hypothetical protein